MTFNLKQASFGGSYMKLVRKRDLLILLMHAACNLEIYFLNSFFTFLFSVFNKTTRRQLLHKMMESSDSKRITEELET